MRRLPQTAHDIALVLGRDRALFLIGQLPVCFVQDKRYKPRANTKGSRRVILYVPKKLKPNHMLVSILGWNDAEKLVIAFGGEIICPPTLRDVVYLPHRDAAIIELARAIPLDLIAVWFCVDEERVRQLLRSAAKIPQEVRKAANDNHGVSAERLA